MTSRLLRQLNIHVSHKPTQKLANSFTLHKEKTTTKDKTNVVYSFPCNDCSLHYVGQTSKRLQTRLEEHQRAIKRQDHLSLPANHALDYGHSFDWDNTRILGQATLKHAREIIEAWHSMNTPSFNRHIELPTAYHNLKDFGQTYTQRTPRTRSQQQMTSLRPSPTVQPLTITLCPSITRHVTSPQATNPPTISQPPIRRSERIRQKQRCIKSLQHAQKTYF